MSNTPAQSMAQLITRRDAILAELAGMTASSSGGQANTTGTGDHVDHDGHRKALYEELERIGILLEQLSYAIGGQSQVRRGRLT